ncbi:MAG: hypothetical protein CMM45_03160 [Rhodospirillaceae bacterium]|nr:hypothetical protein [Rhodospirillaceae bacterium]|tara:strand:- start:889 stop:1107 length:219 start_codon:yes stop_codon:yes gene_type:complete
MKLLILTTALVLVAHACKHHIEPNMDAGGSGPTSESYFKPLADQVNKWAKDHEILEDYLKQRVDPQRVNDGK